MTNLFPRRAALLTRKAMPADDPKAALAASIAQATAELEQKQARLEALVAQVEGMQAAHDDLAPLVTADMDPAAPAVAALAAAIARGTDTIAALAGAVEQLLASIEADQHEADAW